MLKYVLKYIKSFLKKHTQNDGETINLLKYIPKYIKSFLKKHTQNEEPKNYQNLAATNNADEQNIYSDALNCAIKDPDVYNIALTGPYGSGKSSIIKTFIKNHPNKKVLQLSLAAFLTEAKSINETDEQTSLSTKLKMTPRTKQEIERSILQQMLYGTSANKLPFSRFKRIKASKHPKTNITFFIIAFVACFYLFQEHNNIFTSAFLNILNANSFFNFCLYVFNYLAIGITAIFIWKTVYFIYVNISGISLKSISLTNVEIIPKTATGDSILNRHFDEILYFFQSTDYDLVIIEDLDRFDNTDIFVTLREINALINANADIKRKICFLYALRDDMFLSTDRTKFFEFIIPVIPIINHSNSISEIHNSKKYLQIESNFNEQFLKDISYFLSDTRLIRNIFNEYKIYAQKLGLITTNHQNSPNNTTSSIENSALDPNKLLAILIYKNIAPKDFEALHKQKGIFFDIIKYYDVAVENRKNYYYRKSMELEEQQDTIDKEHIKNIDDLYSAYFEHINQELPHDFYCFHLDGQRVRTQDITINDINEIIAKKEYNYLTLSGILSFHQLNTLLQKQLSDYNFEERKKIIEDKASISRYRIQNKIKNLREEEARIKTSKIKKIMAYDEKIIVYLLDKFGEVKNLMQFLISDGFLDDTYYYYISLFHEGRLSRNDQKIFIEIRSYNTPESNFPIDNPANIIADMRESDFDCNHCLNIKLVDCLLSNQTLYAKQITKMLNFIENNFTDCEEFFPLYYSNGLQKKALLCNLYNPKLYNPFSTKNNYISLFTTSKNNSQHIANILNHLSPNELMNNNDNLRKITDYLSCSLNKVLQYKLSFDHNILVRLNIKVQDLNTIDTYITVLNLIIDKQLYILTAENIKVVLKNGGLSQPELDKLTTSHFTTISGSNNITLIDYIERNFNHYFENVLLNQPNNNNENIDIIISIIKRNDLDLGLRQKYLSMQKTIFPSFANIAEDFYHILLQQQCIKASWENVLLYINADAFDKAILDDYMLAPNIKPSLLNDNYIGSDETQVLSDFIYNHKSFPIDDYKDYLNKIPVIFSDFPDKSSDEQKRAIIETHKVKLNANTFKTLNGDSALLTYLLYHNITDYLTNIDSYPIKAEIQELLLNTELSNQNKLKIIENIDKTTIQNTPKIASDITKLLYEMRTIIQTYDPAIIDRLINHTPDENIKIFLLVKYAEKLNDEQLIKIIQQLPEPYSLLAEYGKKPKITKTKDNEELLIILKNRNMITDYRETDGHFSVNKVKIS